MWRAVPLALCVYSVYNAFTADSGLDRSAGIGLPILAAAILMVLPGGIAGDADNRKARELRRARDILAATTFVSICVLVAQTEPWLLVRRGSSPRCWLLCASTSGCVRSDHFGPLGVVLAASVLAVGAIGASLEEFRSPKAQAIAALTQDDRLVLSACCSRPTTTRWRWPSCPSRRARPCPR